MYTPKQGKDKVLMFRDLDEATKESAAKLALQLEHSISFGRDIDNRQTKDGLIRHQGGLDSSVAITAISSDDPVNQLLKDSVLNKKTLECWEVDLSTGVEGQYDALYMQGVIGNWELPANSTELVEVSTTFAVNGKPVAGKVTLSPEQEVEILYAFRDVTPYAGT